MQRQRCALVCCWMNDWTRKLPISAPTSMNDVLQIESPKAGLRSIMASEITCGANVHTPHEGHRHHRDNARSRHTVRSTMSIFMCQTTCLSLSAARHPPCPETFKTVLLTPFLSPLLRVNQEIS